MNRFLMRFGSFFAFLATLTACSNTPSNPSVSNSVSLEHSVPTSDTSVISPSTSINQPIYFKLNSFAGIDVNDSRIIFPLDSVLKRYENCSSEELVNASNFDASENITISSSINTVNKTLTYTVTSLSTNETKNYTYQLFCLDLFHPHSVISHGAEDAFEYSPYSNGYYTTAIGADKCASFYYDGVNPLNKKYYSLNFKVTLNSYMANSEFKIEFMNKIAQERRIVLRTNTDGYSFLLFSDERNSSPFFNYVEHKNQMISNEYEIQLIRNNSNVLYLLNNEYIGEYSFEHFDNFEVMFGCVNLDALISNVTYNLDSEHVLSIYESVVSNTKSVTPHWGKSLTGNGHPEQFHVQEDGTTIVDKTGSTNRVIASPYHYSTPIFGESFYLKGNAKLENTPTDGGVAGKIEFQLYNPDGSAHFKFFLYRYEASSSTNNSIYVEYDNYLLSDFSSLTKIKENYLALKDANGLYTFDYSIIFDRGTIYILIKDKNMITPYIYKKYVGWPTASVLYGVNSMVKATYSKIDISRNEVNVRQEISKYENFNEDYYSFKGGNIIKTFDSFYGKYDMNEGDSSYLYKQDVICRANNYLLDAKVTLNNSDNNSYLAIDLVHDENNAIRYQIYLSDNGKFGVNAYTKINSSDFSNMVTLINPNVENFGTLNVRIIAHNNHYYFFINEECCKGIEQNEIPLGETTVSMTGYNTSIRITDLRYKTDNKLVNQKIDDITYRIEKCSYEKRILDYEKKYKDVEECNLLLMGSSSLDYWYTFAEDLAPIENIVNVGIGGTGILDWNNFMLERLVIRYKPKYILTFVGGNDLSRGVSMEEVARQLEEAMLKLHAALPDTKIYMLGQKPYIGPVANMDRCKRLNENTQRIVNKYDFIVRYIPNWDNYWIDESQNQVNTAYFLPDNMHLTAEGYKIWTQNVIAGIPELYNK